MSTYVKRRMHPYRNIETNLKFQLYQDNAMQCDRKGNAINKFFHCWFILWRIEILFYLYTAIWNKYYSDIKLLVIEMKILADFHN